MYENIRSYLKAKSLIHFTRLIVLKLLESIYVGFTNNPRCVSKVILPWF
jgi:hypothetical protein